MSEYSFTDDPLSQSFTDPLEKTIPSTPVAEQRAAKAHYALGDDSPGELPLQTQILSGGEGDLRQQTSFLEDLKYEKAKNSIIAGIAQNRGAALTPEEIKLVTDLSQTQIKTDPGSILEQKFAEKYINDVVTASRADAEHPQQAVEDRAKAANTLHSKEYFQTRYEDLKEEWEKTGWLSAIPNYLGQLVPFLPWWRQARALAERPSHLNEAMGSTMLDNVQYLYSLPLDERKRQYDAAIKYLQERNPLDALTFAQAMVAFPTSDEYLANIMSLADYTTAGSVLSKVVGKFTRQAAKEAAKTAAPVLENEGKAIVPAQSDIKQIEYQGSNKFTKQPDLFGEQPEQGAFGFLDSMGESTKPITLRKGSQMVYRAPNGQMRSLKPKEPVEVSPTGIFRGEGGRFQFSTEAMKQGDLPLETPVHQGSLDLQPPAFRTPTPEPVTPEPVQTLRRTLADGIKATEGVKAPDPVEVLGAVGEVPQAGFLGAMRRLLNPLGVGNKDVAHEIPSFANPEYYLSTSKIISRARAQLLAPQITKAMENVVGRFTNLAKVSRTTPEQEAAIKAEAEAGLRKDYGRISNSILDVVHTPAELHPSNVLTTSLHIGMPDASLFPSKALAEKFRNEVYELGESEAIPRQQGRGWYLEIARHPDETSETARQSELIVTPKNTSNKGLINMLINRVRSAEDLLGTMQRENRQIAVHAPQEVRKAIREYVHENIEQMGKVSRRAVEDILRQNRDMPSATNPLERGRFYNTAAEFEQAFIDYHKRPPTEKEILGYDAYRRLSDFDWMVRNIDVYRDKARQGIEQYRYHFNTEKGKQTTTWFEGKSHDKMPWSLGKQDQDAGVWIYNTETGKGEFKYKFGMSAEEHKIVDDLIENRGYRVVQVFDPKTHPLKGIAKTAAGEDLKDQVNYIVTNAWEKSPLSWKQVDYRPGGHVIYPNEWYVAQPTIQIGRGGKATYLGDNNILNVETETQARKWAERVDTARRLYKSGQEDALDKYLAENLPYTKDQFLDLFRRHDSPLSLDHTVVYKKRGYNTISTVADLKAQYDRGNLIDSTRNVHDLSNFMDKSFLMDRDNVLSTVLENGKTLQLGPAAQLDPYAALNRAMGQSFRNHWMNDYKIGAVEAWVKEFQHVMQPTDTTLLAHPLFFLYNPQWKKVAETAKPDLAAAKAAQRAIVNFIGMKSELESATDTLKMKLLNGIYSTIGQGRVLDAALSVTADPVQFLRGVAFHSKLGMFNPVQFLVQAQSMAHSIAVAGPRHGLPGFAAAPLIRALGHNPNQLEAVAGVASKLGWTKNQFKEMYETLKQTGLYQVAGEAALRDDAFDPHLFRSTLEAFFFDAGPMFFNEGERMTRMTAFATAFREWRAANTTAKIGNREIGTIMRRADDLSVNMTRASNASWQQGVLSVPMQFFAYNARVMEQLLGGRLTGVEKARVLATYSALYGLPIGVGAGVGAIYPLYDSIKEEAARRGIDLNEGYLKPLTEGLMSQALSWATGKDYNVAQRLGPGNNQTLRDAINGDKKLLDLIGGASGTILGDIYKATHPFWYQAAAVFSNIGEYPIQPSDWLSMFRNISTVDVATKAFGAATYGKWYTKTGTSVADADNLDAAMAVLGLTPRTVTDTFIIQRMQRNQKKAQDFFEKEALENFRRGMQAGQTNDIQGMMTYFQRARTSMEAGDFNYEQQADAFRKAVSQNQDLADKVKWDSVRKAPRSLFKQQFENFFNKGSQ